MIQDRSSRHIFVESVSNVNVFGIISALNKTILPLAVEKGAFIAIYKSIYGEVKDYLPADNVLLDIKSVDWGKLDDDFVHPGRGVTLLIDDNCGDEYIYPVFQHIQNSMRTHLGEPIKSQSSTLAYPAKVSRFPIIIACRVPEHIEGMLPVLVSQCRALGKVILFVDVPDNKQEVRDVLKICTG